VLLLDLPVESACQPLSDVVEVDDAVRVLLEIPGCRPRPCRSGCWEPDRDHRGEDPGFSCRGDLLPLPRTDLRKFQRAFEVRGAVNLGEVSARMANGILVITIPKVAERRGRSAGSR